MSQGQRMTDVDFGPFDAWPPAQVHVEWACVGGRELVAKGFPADVDLAAELDVSDLVPLHDPSDGFFRAG